MCQLENCILYYQGGDFIVWWRRRNLEIGAQAPGWDTVNPKKYAHGFVVLCFVVVMQSFIMNSHEVFIIFIRVALLALGQSLDCHSASEVSLMLYCFVDFSYQNLSDSVWHFWFYMWNVPTWKLYFILPGRRFYRLMTPSKSWNRSSSTRMRYSKSQEICTRFCCALLCCGYAIVHNEFTWSIYHIHQGCSAGTGAIVRLPQCQWSKPDGYGKISDCITTTKHSKAKTVFIFLGIYCSYELC